MRNVLAHAGKSGRRVASTFIDTAFAQESAEAASSQWRAVVDQIRPKVPKLAAIMDDAETDVLAYMTFPREHWVQLHSTNPIERVNGEIKRRTEVVGVGREILPLEGFLILPTPQRGCHHPPGRRDPARTKLRMGGAEVQIHDTGNHRPDQR